MSSYSALGYHADWEDFEPFSFVVSADNAPAGVYSALVAGSGVYTQTLRDQSQWIFDAASGRLQTVRDPQGRTLHLTYSGDPSRLTQITDAADSSRYLALTYTGAGQVQRVVG
jgi:YD repeat-containing protein